MADYIFKVGDLAASNFKDENGKPYTVGSFAEVLKVRTVKGRQDIMVVWNGHRSWFPASDWEPWMSAEDVRSLNGNV